MGGGGGGARLSLPFENLKTFKLENRDDRLEVDDCGEVALLPLAILSSPVFVTWALLLFRNEYMARGRRRGTRPYVGQGARAVVERNPDVSVIRLWWVGVAVATQGGSGVCECQRWTRRRASCRGCRYLERVVLGDDESTRGECAVFQSEVITVRPYYSSLSSYQHDAFHFSIVQFFHCSRMTQRWAILVATGAVVRCTRCSARFSLFDC